MIVPVVLTFTLPTPDGVESAFRTILLIASGLLPGIGSIMNEDSERLALEARARQYDRMRMLFERATSASMASSAAETSRTPAIDTSRLVIAE